MARRRGPDVGTFYGDFSADLARWEKEYAGRPKDELIKLAFLSLEREQLVTVAYHDDRLSRRLAGLELDPAVRELFRHALAFTWMDEERHSVYIRGFLWREGTLRVRARANLHFVTGLIAGWATFVQQHVRWREAPVSRALSSATLWGGLLTGTAPPSVRQHLRYHSFRDFCEFNIDAEKTATLSWTRLAELGKAACLDAEVVAVFERIRDDEILHERLFAILTEALSADDRLRDGLDADALATQIAGLHQELLPRSRRPEAARQPLGAGGVVAVVEGGASREEALGRALEAAGLLEVVEARARVLGKPISALRVVIKTSFMLGLHRGARCTIVAPESVAALVEAIRAVGVSGPIVLEAPSTYDRFFANRTVREVAAYFGFDGDYRLADASEDQVPARCPRSMVTTTLSATWRDADVRIVLGKLRSHPVHVAMLGLSTLDGLGGRADALHFAERQTTPEVAVVTLASEAPPHFSVLDGWDEAPDGLAGMLGTRAPRAPHRWYAGGDALAVDIVAARHLGLPDPYASKQLRTAIQCFGDPRAHLEIVGSDAAVPGWRAPFRAGVASLFMFLATFVYAHASGRGSAFVPTTDEQAFPPLTSPGLRTRVARWLTRWLLGLP